MFIYHNQLNVLDKIVKSGEIGAVRLFRISFGFPMRAKNDFRYNKELGGGALLDAGGYCLKYASYLLGDSAHLTTAQVNYVEGFEVDMYGSATIANKYGDIVQLAFGMDNDYKCEIEIWGSKGSITSNRILTAPVEFKPTYTIKKNQEFDTRELPSDDAFLKSILHFINCVNNPVDRTENYNLIHNQACLVDNFKKLCK